MPPACAAARNKPLTICPADLIDSFQQRRNPVPAVHRENTRFRLRKGHARRRDKERRLAFPPEDPAFVGGISKLPLGDPDYRHGGADGIEQVPAQTGLPLTTQVDVAIYNDCLQILGYFFQQTQNTRELTLVELTGLVRGDGVYFLDDGPRDFVGTPVGMQDARGNGRVVAIGHIGCQYHVRYFIIFAAIIPQLPDK